jgi:phenylacetate-CoA ligase
VLKRNPWVLRWCADLMSREYAHPDLHVVHQEALLERVFHRARHIPAYTNAATRSAGKTPVGSSARCLPHHRQSSVAGTAYGLLSGRKPPRFATIAATSGTTGTPLDVYRSFGSILWEEAFHLQHWHWAGWQRGQRQSILRGDKVIPLDRRDPPFWFKDAAGGQLVLSTRHVDRRTAPLIAEELLRFGSTHLRAYPSAAHELAAFVEEAGIAVHFNAVITGSEMLYDFQRRRIESVFRTRVFDFYSMAERVAYAAECQHGRMHVNPEYGVLEIVDENGQPTDGEGTIVGTSLHNHAVPLIRYKMNDTARWSREPCPCGRTYPVIEKINGRLADQLYDLDGRAVNATVIGFAFDGMRNIRKAQVVQTAADRWVIRIIPSTGFAEIDAQRVLDKLTKQVSARVTAHIELVDDIPALPNGKYQWVVQDFYRGERQVPRAATPARSAARVVGVGG